MLKSLETDEKFVVDLINFDTNTDEIIQINQELSDLQYQVINKMYKFIQGKNYFGVDYHNEVNVQVQCSEEWIKKYLVTE